MKIDYEKLWRIIEKIEEKSKEKWYIEKWTSFDLILNIMKDYWQLSNWILNSNINIIWNKIWWIFVDMIILSIILKEKYNIKTSFNWKLEKSDLKLNYNSLETIILKWNEFLWKIAEKELEQDIDMIIFHMYNFYKILIQISEYFKLNLVDVI